MKIQVRVRLNLNRQLNSLFVSYNTFIKSTFDQYIIASLLVYSKSEEESMQYIDEVTGKGSLNLHFKNLYKELLDKYDAEQLKSILSNSLVPKVNKDEHKYVYYPELDISFYGNDMFQGNISENEQLPRKLAKSDDFIGSSVLENKVSLDSNMYTIVISDDLVELLLKGKRVSMTKEMFESSVDYEVEDIDEYDGVVHNDVQGNGWTQLTTSKVKDVKNSNNYFYHEGDHYMITNKNIKKTEIAKVWGLYLYRETQVEYKYQNSKYCELALETMMESKRINEFKTKGLTLLLKSVNYELTQKYLNYILSKKNSKDLALLGLSVVEKGYEKGWNEEVIKNFKEFSSTTKELTLIYKVDSDLEYSINELVSIHKTDKQILKTNHKETVKAHYEDRNSKIEYINTVSSKITQSGRRDQVKRKLSGDKEAIEYNKLCNKHIAHTKKNIKKLNYDALNARYKVFERLSVLDEKMIKKLEGSDS